MLSLQKEEVSKRFITNSRSVEKWTAAGIWANGFWNQCWDGWSWLSQQPPASPWAWFNLTKPEHSEIKWKLYILWTPRNKQMKLVRKCNIYVCWYVFCDQMPIYKLTTVGTTLSVTTKGLVWGTKFPSNRFENKIDYVRIHSPRASVAISRFACLWQKCCQVKFVLFHFICFRRNLQHFLT